MPKMPMQTPQDLFIHELSDIHSAEGIVVQMLEQAQRLVQNPRLKQGLEQHAEESRQQANNVQQVIEMMGAQPHPVTCHAAQGLLTSLLEVVEANPSPQVLEGAVLAGAVKTEHLEIAAYTGLVEKARAMGQTEAAQLLQQNLQQEQRMLQQVEQLATQMTQQMASLGAQGTGSGAGASTM